MKKHLVSMTLVSGIVCAYCANASAGVTTEQIYQFAKNNDVQALLDNKDSLDVENDVGDTALCSAIKTKSFGAYMRLKESGANTNPKCVRNITRREYREFLAAAGQDNKFLGLGMLGWGLIGAGAVAGGTAIALSVDGGGKSNAPACNHGTRVGDICKCTTGYTGALCDTVADGFIEQGGVAYPKLDCENGGTQNKNRCDCTPGYSGKLCAKQCTLTDENGRCIIIGKKGSNNAKAGQESTITITDYTDATIYGLYGLYGASSATNASGTGSVGKINISNNTADGIYGIHSETYLAYNAYNGGNGLIDIVDNTVDGLIYGIKSAGMAYNAFGKDSEGKINISNNTADGIYGIYSEGDFAVNAEFGGNGLIDIANNIVEGLMYGLYGASSATNAGDSNTGEIKITNNTADGVYGIYSEKDYAVNASSGGNALIDITDNTVNGLIYGIKSLGLIRNASDAGSQGNINITNNTADGIYGIYSETSLAYNADLTGNGSIDIIDNTVDGLIYGIKGALSAENVFGKDSEGKINITNNTADGIYGIHSETSSAYNAFGGGNGSIDITDNAVDGLIYGINSADSAKNAFGKDSEGKINITNNTADGIYGIYSEGDFAVNASSGGNGSIDITDNTVNGLIYGVKSLGYIENASDAGSQGNINITNNTADGIYGIYSETSLAYNADLTGNGSIDITDNTVDGLIYGIKGALSAKNASGKDSKGNINIANNTADGIYGIHSASSAYNADDTGIGKIKLSNNTADDIYGIDSDKTAYNAYNGGNGLIDIADNTVSGNIYGIYGASSAYNAYNNGIGKIKISNNTADNIYGIYGGTYAYNTSTLNSGTGIITIINNSNSNAYGMFSNSVRSGANSTINMVNLTDGVVVGMYGASTADNSDAINIHNLGDGVAIGMAVDNGTATNTGSITISRDAFVDDNFTDDASDDVTYTAKSDRGGTAIGIYGGAGSKIKNTGTITISGADTAYGIWGADDTVTVNNTGSIIIDGDADSANAVKLNGGTLFQNGKFVADNLNLDAMGGTVVASAGSAFHIENEIAGTLTAGADIVANGFDTTYMARDVIDAGDVSNLRLASGSALFDAHLADNNRDIVMTMRDFTEFTDNKSLAAFLKNNYAGANGADLFGSLKSIDNMGAVTNALSTFTGLNSFTRFGHQDLAAMREINFSMSQKLFENRENDDVNVVGATNHFSFSNGNNAASGRYGLSSSRISDNWKMGYGLSMANISTGGDDGINRINQIGLFYMPVTYSNDAYELVMNPRVGFARSEYTRAGFGGQVYNGFVEKRIFGLSNDLRYPIKFGGLTLVPDLGFNATVYNQSGHEENKAFALVIPYDNIVSVETGLGFYAKYDRDFQNGGKLTLNSGVMAYREFGDCYNMKLGIRDMAGTFALYDDNEYKYRGAATFGFNYNSGRVGLYGNAQYFMDNDHYMNLKGGINFRF